MSDEPNTNAIGAELEAERAAFARSLQVAARAYAIIVAEPQPW